MVETIEVGSAVRLMIFRRVDLQAPLWPIIPILSPCSIHILQSQNFSWECLNPSLLRGLRIFLPIELIPLVHVSRMDL
jgi:hypothetical protein